jgi:hypothetical protein
MESMGIIAFWHCFGVHAGESPEEILQRKQKEIDATGGWTLWSFSRKTFQTIELWRSEIKRWKPVSVLALCSQSKGAIDPKGIPTRARVFRTTEESNWQTIPDTINVPHPFGEKTSASAFRVSRVLSPSDVSITTEFHWLRVKDRVWCDERIPTRGEYLLRPGRGAPLRPIRAVLELQEPFVVEIAK